MKIQIVISMLKKIIKRIGKARELNKYTDFTIAKYFREQGAKIGENNRIEVRSLGAEPYLVRIGDHCTIAPGVKFVNHDGATWLFTDEVPSLQKFGTIEIMDNCFIGLGSILMGNIKIGPNSIVAAGAVVTKDVPEGTIVGGNPAKFICSIDEYKQKVISNWEKQKPQDYLSDLINHKAYSPEEIQRMKFRDLDILEKHLKEYYKNI